MMNFFEVAAKPRANPEIFPALNFCWNFSHTASNIFSGNDKQIVFSGQKRDRQCFYKMLAVNVLLYNICMNSVFVIIHLYTLYTSPCRNNTYLFTLVTY